MGKVLKRPPDAKQFVRTRHGTRYGENVTSPIGCGAVVEFSREDVKEDHEGAYAMCPFCKDRIPASRLKWRWE